MQGDDNDAKRRKKEFLMFTRVLMKYLEQKDPDMHARAKAVIRESAEKNRKKEAGYESATANMQRRLRSTVGEWYWKRTQVYLDHFLEQKRGKTVSKRRRQRQRQRQRQQSGSVSSSQEEPTQ